MRSGTKKLFYKIGEVCKFYDLEPHVLRYWEEEFPLLSPSKNRAGQRIYREKDLRLIGEIKSLLYEQGFTIAGARRRLKDGQSGKTQAGASARRRETLSRLRRELEGILELLDQEDQEGSQR